MYPGLQGGKSLGELLVVDVNREHGYSVGLKRLPSCSCAPCSSPAAYTDRAPRGWLSCLKHASAGVGWYGSQRGVFYFHGLQ